MLQAVDKVPGDSFEPGVAIGFLQDIIKTSDFFRKHYPPVLDFFILRTCCVLERMEVCGPRYSCIANDSTNGARGRPGNTGTGVEWASLKDQCIVGARG